MRYAHCWLGVQTQYHTLSGKEQESYNAAKLRALMADWGYLEAFTVNGDKHGADLLFYRAEDGNIMKVQLKGRPTLNKAYKGKDIYIAFQHKSTGKWYVYDHDSVLASTLDLGHLAGTKSWDVKGSWSWPTIPAWLDHLLSGWHVPVLQETEALMSEIEAYKWGDLTQSWEMT
tara:strand:- start:355 stop:873 length:519 start_codon:yes stop_codon:yes gene_type:complete